MTRPPSPAVIETEHSIYRLLGMKTPPQAQYHSGRHDITDDRAGRLIVDIFAGSVSDAARGHFIGRVYSWRDNWTAWYEITPKNPNEPFPRKRRAKES